MPAVAVVGVGQTKYAAKRQDVSIAGLLRDHGKEPLGHQSRFADIDLHNKLAGQIRRDKEGLRQAQLRGGYGERRSG